MDWDDLRFVLALSRGTTLAQAASALGVTHTTVGRRLRALEARLGVRLFDRTPEGFVATTAGQDLTAVAEHVEEDVLAAEARVLGQDVRLAGPLRVSTMDLFFCGLHHAFASFVERYPTIALEVGTEQGRVSLSRREADVALRLTNDPPEYLVGRKVGRLSFAPYAAASLVARVGEGAPMGAFPWLGWADSEGRAWLDRWLAAHAPGARVVLRLDDNARARETAIREGTGAFFLACFEGDAMPGVQRIGPVQEGFDHDVWLLTLRDLRRTPRVRAFMDHMAEAFAALPGVHGGPGGRWPARPGG